METQLVGSIEFKVDDNYPAPEDSTRFNEKLRQDLGELEGYPRYRVIWGQDERYKVWQAGKQRLRYIYATMREERLYGATILNSKTGKSRFLNFKQMGQFEAKKGELILPQVELFEKEIGEPFYWLEYYCTPKMLGSEEDWNLHRWLDQGDGHKLDLTGAYPKNGRYEPLLRLSYLDDETERYKPLNDATYDYIRSMLLGDKKKLSESLKEQKLRFKEEADEMFNDPGINREVDIITKHRVSI